MPLQYDLVLKGGLLIDPAQGIHAKKDIAFRHSKVVRVEDNLDAEPRRNAAEVIDASGRIVTPGLIDLHVHARVQLPGQPAWDPRTEWLLGVDPDRHLATGVTTAVDAGTYGVDNLPLAIQSMSTACRTRVLAFANPRRFGLAGRADLAYVDDAIVERLTDLCERNPDVIVGIKVLLTHHYWGNRSTLAQYLEAARTVADRLGLPVMIHGVQKEGGEWRGLSPQQLLQRTRPGDIITHCCCPRKGVMNWEADEIRSAVNSGLVLDVGHGTGSFGFDAAEKALELGLPPTTISSDLHQMNYLGPTFDLPTTMSKFLLLGMSLDEVVERTTTAPARVIGKEDHLGTLKPGATADAAIFDLLEGEFTFEDAYDQTRRGRRKLVSRAVVRAGTVYLGATWSDAHGVPPGPLHPRI
jgi:dihydroorotase